MYALEKCFSVGKNETKQQAASWTLLAENFDVENKIGSQDLIDDDDCAVDGNDALALYHCLQHAINQARDKQQPQLIEAITYRICDHTTADDAKRYTCADEHNKALKLDPIKRLKQFLEHREIWNNTHEKQHLQEATDQITQAVERYLNQSPQSIKTIYQHHYAHQQELNT